ncbi:uncharacterized protein LOC121376916 [Gigantopelta aegis]|uniref:uncharacterized protein LOC121376916 n=1 Tax=Gigantopelta aegis TaxID=1735272 RepID=UPI001B88D2A0|nr:uncharacterized protein LOC121376916 [Gigantopelta aegis]XP_041360646.1 uncharacterized protein LOC121376916 [Gigantopelta aegis]
MPSTVSFRAAIGTAFLMFGTAIHVAAIACPYWFHLTYRDIALHEGLWEICLSNKTSGSGQCHQIPSSYPVWFHGVQTLELLGGLCELVTMVVVVCYLCKGATYYNWLCQFFGVFAGLLNVAGGIIYTQRTNYPEWNLVQTLDAARPILVQITEYQSELSWAFGLAMGSSGLDCVAAIFFVWESVRRVTPPTILPYQLLT